MGFGNFIKDQFLNVIEFVDDSPKKLLVSKFHRKGNEIKQGARLIVRNGQVAVFVCQGQIADVFGSGHYRLDTGNLPLLSALGALPTLFNSEIKSDIYFINTTQFINNSWRTKNPILKRDPEMGIVRISSSGTYSFKVNDPAIFMTEIFGARSLNMTSSIVDYLTSFIGESIAQCLGESTQSVIDLATHYRGLSSIITPYVNKKANMLGLEITTATIESISLPKGVEKLIDEQSGIGLASRDMDTFVRYQSARAIRDVAKQPGGMSGIGAGIGVGKMVAQTMNDSLDGTKTKKQTKNPKESLADQLIKYKGLCDKGILTQEEFDQLKRMLLKEI